MKITLDTTILARSHQNSKGLARALLLELLKAKHDLVLSGSILDELERVLSYPRLAKSSKLQPHQITEYLEFLSSSSELVEIDDALAVPIRDADDTHIIRTAIAGCAEIICTLDVHFYDPVVLDFCRTRGIHIVKDVDLLQLIRNGGGKRGIGPPTSGSLLENTPRLTPGNRA